MVDLVAVAALQHYRRINSSSQPASELSRMALLNHLIEGPMAIQTSE